MAGSVVTNATNSLFYREATAALICFSLTDRETFTNAKQWADEIDQNCGSDKNIIKYLVGLQMDKDDDDSIDFLEANQFVQDNNFKNYFQTSAKTGKNIDKLFKTLS